MKEYRVWTVIGGSLGVDEKFEDEYSRDRRAEEISNDLRELNPDECWEIWIADTTKGCSVGEHDDEEAELYDCSESSSDDPLDNTGRKIEPGESVNYFGDQSRFQEGSRVRLNILALRMISDHGDEADMWNGNHKVGTVVSNGSGLIRETIQDRCWTVPMVMVRWDRKDDGSNASVIDLEPVPTALLDHEES